MNLNSAFEIQKWIIKVVIFMVSCPKAFGVWAPLDSASTILSLHDIQINIKNDGTAQETTRLRWSINSQKGLEVTRDFKLTFYPESAQLISMSAGVLTKVPQNTETSVEQEVPLDESQDLSGDLPLTVIRPKFKELKIGDTVEIRYKVGLTSKQYKDFFSWDYYPGRERPEKLKIHVESEIPLFYQVRDPRGQFNVQMQEAHGAKFRELRIESQDWIDTRLANESNSVLPINKTARIAISTRGEKLPAPDKMEDILANEAIINERGIDVIDRLLPSLMAISDQTQQLRGLIGLTHRMMKYKPNNESMRGLMVSRRIDEMIRLGVGDCKDFTNLMTHILRRLGYKAYPAWVWLGINADELLPFDTLDRFNHTLVAIESDAGRPTVWVDPVNQFIIDGSSPAELSHRQALILDPQKLRFEMIPESQPENNKTEVIVTKKLDKGMWSFKAELHLKGPIAYPFGVNEGETDVIQRHLGEIQETYVTNSGSKAEVQAIPSQWLNPVIQLDLTFNYPLQLNTNEITNLGFLSKPYSSPLLDRLAEFRESLESRIGDLEIMDPQTISEVGQFKNIEFLGSEGRFDCTVHSKWLDYELKARQTPLWIWASDKYIPTLNRELGLVVSKSLVVKKSKILREEMDSDEFNELIGQAKKCAGRRYFIFRSRGEKD